MKTNFVISLVFGCLAFSQGSFAKEELSQLIGSKTESQASEKKSRRKKIQMCHECGKPEPQCECEGEGHGVKDDHADKHDEEN